MDVTDDALVQRSLNGDAAAFECLVDRHYASCLRFATRQLGRVHDAEEVVQDAFVRAYRSLPRCRKPERFRSWLMTIVVNRCRTRAAKERRRIALLERLRWFHADGTTAPPDPPDQGNRSAVQSALNRLSPSLREAFLLRHVEELSYEEMAAVTGARRSALRMRVKRAADAMARMLEDVHA